MTTKQLINRMTTDQLIKVRKVFVRKECEKAFAKARALRAAGRI